MRRVFAFRGDCAGRIWQLHYDSGMMQSSAIDPGQSASADSSRPPTPQGWKRLTSVQVMLAVALALGLVLVLNFSGRIRLDRDLGRIHAQFVAEIGSLQAERQRLRVELDYVKSDAYVEIWARDDGKMVREGETLIFPKSLGGGESLPVAANTTLAPFETSAPKPTNLELWWALFFDSPAP